MKLTHKLADWLTGGKLSRAMERSGLLITEVRLHLEEIEALKARAEKAEAALAAMPNVEARAHIAALVDTFGWDIPEANCSCHLAPPCDDCVEHSYAREVLAEAKAFLAATA